MSERGSVRLLVLAVSVAIVAAVVVGLVLAGPPGNARLRKLDMRRVSNLYSIVDAVEYYWADHESLPPNLAALADHIDFDSKSDPETGEPYIYRVLGNRRYEVCAIFAMECQSEDDECTSWRGRKDARIRRHEAGEQCFEFSPKEREKKPPP